MEVWRYGGMDDEMAMLCPVVDECVAHLADDFGGVLALEFWG
jgi:hypothetical protein